MVEEFLQKQISLDLIIRIIPLLLAFYLSYRQILVKSISLKPRLYISLFYLAFGLMQILTIFYYLELLSIAKLYLLVYVPIILSISPLFFLYVKSISQQNVFRYNLKDIVHFFPGVLIFITLLVLYIIYTSATADSIFQKKIFDLYWLVIMFSVIVLFLSQNIVYIISIALTYKKHKKSIKEVFSYDKGISLEWLKLFILGYIIFVFIISLSELISYSFYNLSVEFITIAYLLYSGFYTLRQTDIYKKSKKTETAKSSNSENIALDSDQEKKYIGSALKDEEKILEIKTKLVEILEKDKSYLNPKLSIYDIALVLDINYKYLSQVINQEMNISFVGFVNNYRIEEAKLLLLNTDYQQYTIEAISQMAGFNSKSAFNTSFKKDVGITPSAYRKNNRLS